MLHAVQGLAQGLADGGAYQRNQFENTLVRADHLVAQPFDERRCQSAGHGRDQIDPVGGKGRGEHGHGQDQPGPQPGLLGVEPEQLAVREPVRAADVQDQSCRGRGFQAADKVAEHIRDGDWLAECVHPAGRDHDRQAVHEVAHDFKGCAARAQNHGGPEPGGLHRAGLENAADLGAGAQVLAEARAVSPSPPR